MAQVVGAPCRREKKKGPALRGLSWIAEPVAQDTFGSLNASISSLKSLIGTQLQNTFLSP